MDLPKWQERAFEGRVLRVTPLGGEEKFSTRIGTRWATPARVEILSGIFAGQAYERVLLFSEGLRRQLEAGPVTGRLKKATSSSQVGSGWLLFPQVAVGA